MHARTGLLIALAIATIVPGTGVSDWYGRGFYEPDTARDRTGGWMWTEPDVSPSGERVYFSGFVSQSAGAATAVNPNVGLVGSQLAPYPTVTNALLGVWKDCNRDGYIGLTESPLMGGSGVAGQGVADPTTGQQVAYVSAPLRTNGNYSSLLLPNNDVCPVDSRHNDGTNVSEWHAILDTDGSGAAPIEDSEARVWADYGLPEDLARASCPVNPRPRGTYQSTGGFLRYVDCMTSWRATGTVNALAHATGVNAISFADAPQERPDRSGSILNQQNPWGHEDDASYVSAFDCSQRVIVHDSTGASHVGASDPTGGALTGPKAVPGVTTITIFPAGGTRWVNATDGNYDLFVAGSPRAPTVDPSGSMGGTVNETGESVFVTSASSAGEGSCDRDDDAGGTDSGEVYESLEADFEATAARRTQTDYYYAPSGYYWFGQPSYVVSRNPFVNREDLQPWGSTSITFYAAVGPNTTTMASLPSASVGTYGSPHCSGTTEITGGFACDGAKWWLGPGGNDISTVWQVRVGRGYHLIDIDCWDHSPARGAPGIGDLTGNPCQR